jgi:flagellar M-ring protein FliF
MERLGALARRLGPARLAIIAAVVAATVGLFVFIIGRLSTAPMALLYGDLDAGDASHIVSELERQAIPYRLENNGATIFAPADQVPRLRVKLAEQGVPAGGSVGYELFDTTNTLGATSFQQNVNLVRALEGELARTIRAIDTVRAARVHLVLPQRELFSRERPQPTASVLLQMRGNARLSPGQVVAVQHLIASAVPDLTPERVSIIDGHGTLLSERDDDSDPASAIATKADERRRELESHLRQTVDDLLERVIGPGKVRTQVFADMDFDRINTSQEVYDPDGQVVRSTQTVNEQNSTLDGDGSQAVTVANNLPDPNASTNAATNNASRSSEKRKEETVNYEISKKTINHVREAGVIKRLSVAVLVDGTYGTDAKGAPTYQPRSPAEIEKLTALVKGAIGFDAKRGDQLEVVSMRFADADTDTHADAGWLPMLGNPDLWRLGQYLLLTLFGLLVALFVVRPVLSRALDGAPALAGPGLGAAGKALGAAQVALPPPGQAAGQTPAITGPEHAAAEAYGNNELIDVAGIDGKVRGSALRHISDIAEKNPEETLSLLRNWLQSDE